MWKGEPRGKRMITLHLQKQGFVEKQHSEKEINLGQRLSPWAAC